MLKIYSKIFFCKQFTILCMKVFFCLIGEEMFVNRKVVLKEMNDW